MHTRITVRAAVLLLAAGFAATRGEPGPANSTSPRATAPAAIVPRAGSARYDAQGRMIGCVLAQDARFAGQALPAGSSLVFRANGSLQRCTLARDATLSGQLLPAKSTVFFTLENQMSSCWLATATVIQGYLCAANRDGFGNCFYPDGKLRAAWLARDEVIDGVPCTSRVRWFKMPPRALRAGTGRMVHFFPDGRLQQAMVSRDVIIDGREFKPGDIVRLDRDGRLDLGNGLLPPPARW